MLMVEDSAWDYELIRHQLESTGYTLFVERVDREPALRKALEEVQWDIVLVDYFLPGFCCLTALKLIRTLAAPTPVLGLTGSADPNVRTQMLEAGAHACLDKNEPSTLCAAVKRALHDP
jgi:CheY-like chemotaxis protein